MLLLTDTRGEDVSREEDDGIGVLADTLDGRQEPGSASYRLHTSAVNIVDVIEVDEGDGVRPRYRHLVFSRLAKGTITDEAPLETGAELRCNRISCLTEHETQENSKR